MTIMILFCSRKYGNIAEILSEFFVKSYPDEYLRVYSHHSLPCVQLLQHSSHLAVARLRFPIVKELNMTKVCYIHFAGDDRQRT